MTSTSQTSLIICPRLHPSTPSGSFPGDRVLLTPLQPLSDVQLQSTFLRVIAMASVMRQGGYAESFRIVSGFPSKH